MELPDFQADGYLPPGVHLCDEPEIIQRFGIGNLARRRLGLRVQTWLAMARAIHAKRFLIDGSFVTAKEEPNDVDAVIWLPENFSDQVALREEPAETIQKMLVTRYPEELLAARTQKHWDHWVEFFSQTTDPVCEIKGLVEVRL